LKAKASAKEKMQQHGAVGFFMILFSMILMGVKAQNSTIYIGYMSYLTRNPESMAIEMARHIAKHAINNQGILLPGRPIEFVYKDETIDPDEAFLCALELAGIQVRPNTTNIVQEVPLVLGALRSPTTISAATTGTFFDTPFLSSTATALELSDRVKYPTFSRLVPNDGEQAHVAAELSRRWGWTRMGILFTSNTYASGLAAGFRDNFEKLGGTILISQSFSPSDTANISSQIEKLRDSGAIIFYLAMYFEDFLFAKDELERQGMLGPPYVYFATDSVTFFFDDPKMDGLIALVPGSNSSAPAYQEMLSQWQLYQSLEAGTTWGALDVSKVDSYSPYGYDTVMTAGYLFQRYYALQEVCNQSLPKPPEFAEWFPAPTFNTTDPCITYNKFSQKKLLYKILRYVHFDGASGEVQFDQYLERTHAVWDLMNRRGNTWMKVGAGTLDEEFVSYQKVLWPGDSYKVPLDVPYDHHVDHPGSFIAIGALLLVLMISLIICITVYYDVRVIKSASPKFLQIILIGSVCLVISAILHVITQTPAICGAKLWLLHIGATLAVGSLFLTLYRLHKVFNNTHLQRLDYLKDRYLLLALSGLVILDIFLLIIWTAAFPFSIDKIHRCSSDGATYIFPLLAALKGIYISSAGALTYYTRNVPTRFSHNASVALSVYSLAIVSFIWILFAQVIGTDPEQATFRTKFEAGCLLASQFVLILLLFAPKVHGLYTSKEVACCGGFQHLYRRWFGNQSKEAAVDENQPRGLEVAQLEELLAARNKRLVALTNASVSLTSEAMQLRETVFIVEEEYHYLQASNKRRSSVLSVDALPRDLVDKVLPPKESSVIADASVNVSIT